MFIGKYVIVRTYSAGVFAGVLESKEGQSCVVKDARRFWYWSGAASLSELSLYGVKNPTDCKFPEIVPFVQLEQVIEILPVSDKAKASIESVKPWKA